MRNILVLTEGYFGKATANGICAKAIVDEMKMQGIQPLVISCDDEVDHTLCDGRNVSICNGVGRKRVKKNKMVTALRLIRSVILHSRTPEYSKNLVSEIVSAGKTMFQEKNIDTIVCVYFPIETVVAGYELKGLFPDTKLIVYEVDSVVDGITGSSKWGRHIVFSYKRFMSHLYERADRIIVIKCHKEAWLAEHEQHRERLRIADLPLLCKRVWVPKTEKNRQTVSFLYSGVFDLNYRTPIRMIDIFQKVGNIGEWKIHLYSKGCEDYLQQVALANSWVENHGYVEQAVLEEATAAADFLLCIGNRVSASLPSKLITYMTYGKPIIHFSLQKNDVCAEYLKRYPLALCISCDENEIIAAEKIKEFMRNVMDKTVEYEEISDIFRMNHPAYSVALISDDEEQMAYETEEQ